MKIFVILIVIISLNFLSTNTFGMPKDGKFKKCYNISMIGYDSVINAKLGVKPEDALKLTEGTNFSEKHPYNEINILSVIWGAYLWDSDAHSYATSTFWNCSQKFGENND